jgi:succinate dehydrogenase flavin-adding protein (antitoxin of CptAB toxin-antitoxin module)
MQIHAIPKCSKLNPLRFARLYSVAIASAAADSFDAVPSFAPSPKIKRLIYQSATRGILENDLILGSFIRFNKHRLSEIEWDQLDVLLAENDWDLFYWATKRIEVPFPYSQFSVLHKITAFIESWKKNPIETTS